MKTRKPDAFIRLSELKQVIHQKVLFDDDYQENRRIEREVKYAISKCKIFYIDTEIEDATQQKTKTGE